MSSDDIKKWKGIFKANVEIFSPEERKIGEALSVAKQAALFAKWRNPGQKDAEKKKMLNQIAPVQSGYPGGLPGYSKQGIKLFKRIKKNPFASFSVSAPEGVNLTDAPEDLKRKDDLELKGTEDAGKLAFCLVAGGMGERLGYSGSKVSLPVDISSEVSFLEFYIQNILALQEYANANDPTGESQVKLPLAIMTSDDTFGSITAALEENKNFGMEDGQITIVKQIKVPCFRDTKGNFAVDPKDPFSVVCKPHGHGDVHKLLLDAGVVEPWTAQGIKWLVFIQDTNHLAFQTILAAVGSCIESSLAATHICIPRKPGEAVGAICKMTNKKKPDESYVANVEYNYLGKILKKDPVNSQGHSALPGNTNTLVFNFPAYVEALEKTGGIMPEFINPKWKDANQTQFRSPPRIESMMQDMARFVTGNVSYITFPRWVCFAPAKNNTAEAKEIQKNTGNASSPGSSEMARYLCYRRQLRAAGVIVDEGKDTSFQGIQAKSGARVVLSPSFGITSAEVRSKFQPTEDSKITISSKSTLILDGEGITIGGLDLDGTLIIRACRGAKVHVQNLSVRNKGWDLVNMKAPKQQSSTKQTKPRKSKYPEHFHIRGFRLNKHEAFEVVYDKPGHYELFKQTQKGRIVVGPVQEDDEEENASSNL